MRGDSAGEREVLAVMAGPTNRRSQIWVPRDSIDYTPSTPPTDRRIAVTSSLPRAFLLLLLAAATPKPLCGDEPFPAHKVAGNTYYVGSKALATYLITTPEGLILINSSFEETVP